MDAFCEGGRSEKTGIVGRRLRYLGGEQALPRCFFKAGRQQRLKRNEEMASNMISEG